MNAKKKFDHSNDLVFLPLGGTGEIGMNCYCYGVGPTGDRQWLEQVYPHMRRAVDWITEARRETAGSPFAGLLPQAVFAKSAWLSPAPPGRMITLPGRSFSSRAVITGNLRSESIRCSSRFLARVEPR